MSTPNFDSVISVAPVVIEPTAGSYKFPAAIKSGGTVVDFTAGSWVFQAYVRPVNPALYKGAAQWSTGVTITGDAAGFITIAWTAAASIDAALTALTMLFSVIASNDAFTTSQQAGSGNLTQHAYA